MERTKPKLVAAAVPWAVASTSHLKVHVTESGELQCLTFVGYFKLKDRSVQTGGSISIMNAPDEFRSVTENYDGSAYRMIRMTFFGAKSYRTRAAISDREVIAEADYDWSAVPGALRVGENAVANIKRATDYWILTGMSPDPGVYEIKQSPWVAEVSLGADNLRHYMVVGDDDSVDVLAKGWDWEAGQTV
ncbi:MAG: hypothetical protein U1E28_02095 [Beijerinckiaceae bacterium]